MVNLKYQLDLSRQNTNFSQLKSNHLPIILNPFDLSHLVSTKYQTFKKLILPENVLREYRLFKIPKKTGGYREIIVPSPILKKIQSEIYKNILEKIRPSNFAHGFTKAHSIVSNAREHLKSRVIYQIDLKNFFPSIKDYKVHAVFKRLGYSGYISHLFSILCTILPGSYDSTKNQFKSTTDNLRFLPTGACTSPSISNLACIELDKQLNGISEWYGFVYTRYADDITFSCRSYRKISSNFRNEIQWIIKKHGFIINRKKEKFSYNRNFQRVTGVNVQNEELSLPRKWIKNLRSALFHLKKTHNELNNDEVLKLVKNIEGRCAYAMMVNKKKYHHFITEFKSIKKAIVK